MKSLKRILFASFTGIALYAPNVALAAEETTDSGLGYAKFIAMGVAIIIIALLLFLGYKMDNKENGEENYEMPKSRKQKKTSGTEDLVDDVKYEADDIAYESDKVNYNELIEPTEYEADDDKIFSSSSDEDYDFDVPEVADTNEETEEEFDTSIIDNIDNIDEVEETKSPKSFDETMIFKEPIKPELEAEEQPKAEEPKEETLEKSEEMKELDNALEEADPLMEELNKIEEIESDKPAFSKSVEEKPKKFTKAKKAETAEAPKKKTTKAKKEESSASSSVEAEFLAQMEENLKRSQAERDAKKKNS